MCMSVILNFVDLMDFGFAGVERRRIYDIVNVLESVGVRLLNLDLLKFQFSISSYVFCLKLGWLFV